MNRFLAPVLLALCACPVAAQDSGLSFSGEAKLEYVNSSPDMLAFRGEALASWRLGGLFGFDASVDAIQTDNGDEFTNFWAAAVLTMGSGEIAVGAPRPLLETYRVMPRFSSSRAIDFDSVFIRGPFTAFASAQDNGMTPGITYTQTSGGLTFGAGYHRLNDGTDIDAVEGIMRYEGGATSYFISAEYLVVPSDDLLTMQIGALHDGDRFDAGVALTRARATDSVNSLRLYAGFDVMPSLSVKGDLLLVEGADDIKSLSTTYEMDSGLFVEGGGTFLNGSDEIYDIGIGYKF